MADPRSAAHGFSVMREQNWVWSLIGHWLVTVGRMSRAPRPSDGGAAESAELLPGDSLGRGSPIPIQDHGFPAMDEG